MPRSDNDPATFKERLAELARKLGLSRTRKVVIGLTISLLVLLLAIAWSFLALAPETPGDELTLSQLRDRMAQSQVVEASFLDEDAQIVGILSGGDRFHTAYPEKDSATALLLDDLINSGAEVDVDHQVGKSRIDLTLTVILPLMVLANLFALFLVAARGGSAGIGEVVDFGRMSSGRKGGGDKRVTFADVAGVEDAEVELREVVEYLRAPERYEQLGANPPKGVLLFGPPGCGKTLMAKAVAGEAGVPFFSVSGAQFVESLVGVGAARVRDLFARVREAAPAILFVDELDAAGRKRGAAGASTGGSDEREQTLNQLLVEMDGFDTGAGIVVIGATNRPDILDPALLRPGRFDRHIHVQPPDLGARRKILELHAASRPLDKGVDFTELARQTPGFTGADLANVINEAALLSVRSGTARIGSAQLNEAVLRVIGGTSSRGHLMSDDERHRIAVHEAGHAVVRAALGHADEVHRVSIVARGRGLGISASQRSDDAVVLSRSQLVEDLVSTLGGRVAETIVLEEPSTAAEDDVEKATELATALVAKYGMAEDIGVRRLLLPTVDVHLGIEEALADLSPELHAQFDRAVHDVLEEALATAASLLETHRDPLDAVTERLVAIETVDGDALRELLPAPIANGTAKTKKKSSKKRATAKS